jgi:hypothetical protein
MFSPEKCRHVDVAIGESTVATDWLSEREITKKRRYPRNASGVWVCGM